MGFYPRCSFCALLLLACERALVVGEHGGAGRGREDAATAGAAGIAFPDAPSDEASDPGADASAGAGGGATSDSSDVVDVGVDATADGDGSPADGASPDRPIIPGCLPDGAGQLTFQSSGGLVLDIAQGNEINCTGSVTGSQVSVTDQAGPILGGHAALKVDLVFDNLAPGYLGVLPVHVTITEIAGALPPVWISSDTQCSAEITTHGFLEPTDAGALYELGGSVTCTGTLAPAPDNANPPVTITLFRFMTAVLYP